MLMLVYTNLCIFRDRHFEKVFENQVMKICLYGHAPLNKPQLHVHACTCMCHEYCHVHVTYKYLVL